MKKTAARLGQHFLANDYYAKVLADAVAVQPSETIVEVGPGKGALTKHLLATGAPVIAIEKDEALAAALPSIFPHTNLRVVTGDIRSLFGSEKTTLDARHGERGRGAVPERTVTRPRGPRNEADGVVLSLPYVVAANIPYYITGEIIRRFLEAEHQPRAMALLIQKEVAERIVARGEKESILSLSVKVFGTPKIVTKVGKGNFNPPPQVDSAIILIENISRAHFASRTDEQRFFEIVRAGFASKRKLLASNLVKVADRARVAAAFEALGISPTARAEELTLAAWLALKDHLN